MITVTEEATRAVRDLCSAAGHDARVVRVRAVSAGTPMPVTVTADPDRRPGDLATAADGVVVLVDRDLAAAVDGHTLDARPDDDGAPQFVLHAPRP